MPDDNILSFVLQIFSKSYRTIALLFSVYPIRNLGMFPPLISQDSDLHQYMPNLQRGSSYFRTFLISTLSRLRVLLSLFDHKKFMVPLAALTSYLSFIF
jgi:hypothetical protein